MRRGDVGGLLHEWLVVSPQEAHAGGLLGALLRLLLTLHLLMQDQLDVLLKKDKQGRSKHKKQNFSWKNLQSGDKFKLVMR